MIPVLDKRTSDHPDGLTESRTLTGDGILIVGIFKELGYSIIIVKHETKAFYQQRRNGIGTCSRDAFASNRCFG